VKRLAVEVEDHPLEYATFEGEIPAGSYGAGSVIVWDQGTYELTGTKAPERQLADGHLEVELKGEKLRGTWSLFRTSRGDTKNQWLLVKRPDAYAGGPEPTSTRPESVRSQRTIALKPGIEPPAPELATHFAGRKLPRARLTPQALPFMLPTLATDVPRGEAWVYEIKWDGIRVLALREEGRVRLVTRGGLDLAADFPEITAAVARVAGGDLALDVEIVALDEHGRARFQLLQQRGKRGRGTGTPAPPIVAYAFDCLAVLGRDVRGLALTERKSILREMVGDQGSLRYCDHVAGDGQAVLESVREIGLEGVVAKRADARYHGGRRREWLKVKVDRRQEFVIGGYTDPKGTRSHLGALHLGVYDDGRLIYVGRAGSGMDETGLGRLASQLEALATAECPFTGGTIPKGREHHWVEPRLVCEVRFSEWTDDGSIRHPVFLGLRDDRAPESVRRETAVPPPPPSRPTRVSAAKRKTPARARGSAAPRRRRRP
jgi:bifunctional non-homologous end joining protein LigD